MRNGIETKGEWFVIFYPDGHLSDLAWRSPHRAMVCAMEEAGCEWWPDLRDQGFRILASTPELGEVIV